MTESPRNEHRERDRASTDRVEIPGERARQGHIVLNTPARRWIFIGGLIGFVVIALLGSVLF
ncbi:MAG TPA: hypothetical protein VK943_09480 [Arenibaculum sp.]|nr:hypothetical protein [Arenibaculum sp.]